MQLLNNNLLKFDKGWYIHPFLFMIIVCSLPDHRNVCESVKASHLISVIDPGFQPETPSCVKSHLKLGFDDSADIKEENQVKDIKIQSGGNSLFSSNKT